MHEDIANLELRIRKKKLELELASLDQSEKGGSSQAGVCEIQHPGRLPVASQNSQQQGQATVAGAQQSAHEAQHYHLHWDDSSDDETQDYGPGGVTLSQRQIMQDYDKARVEQIAELENKLASRETTPEKSHDDPFHRLRRASSVMREKESLPAVDLGFLRQNP